jgi:type IV pilus assembly protein PilM
VSSGVTVLLNAGASAINVNIIRGDQSLFTRDISIGGNAFTEAVQKEFGLAFEAAEHAKQGIVPEGVTFDDVRAVLRTVSETVLLEIEKTFDFFKATTSDEHVDRIVICGGASRVDGFAELLSERLGAAVERLDPFKAVELDPARLGGALPDDVTSTAAVAVGLALRRAGDR